MLLLALVGGATTALLAFLCFDHHAGLRRRERREHQARARHASEWERRVGPGG